MVVNPLARFSVTNNDSSDAPRTISVQHSEADIDLFVDVFADYCRTVTS